MVSNPKQIYEKILGRIIPRNEWIKDWIDLPHNKALEKAKNLSKRLEMKRKIDEVRSISISEDVISIHHSTPIPDRFERNKWSLVVEDVINVKDASWIHRMAVQPDIRKSLTTISVKAGIGVSCQILEDEKIILCGERPEEMFID